MFSTVKGFTGMREPSMRTWERKEERLRKDTPLAPGSPLSKKKKARNSVNGMKQLASLCYWRPGWHSVRGAKCQPGNFIGILFSALPPY